MNEFVIDESRCIQCGECVIECPTGVIEMKEYPVLERAGCMECGHCLAVCPTGALSILGKDPANSTPLMGHVPSAAQMETLIKGRRSVRRYRAENVAPETVQALLDITAHAPTGVNVRAVRFTIIDDKETMHAFCAEVYAQLAGVLPQDDPSVASLIAAVKEWNENGTDQIFRGAPHLVITSAPKATPCPEADTHLALAYFELMAQSMGLGTVWNGRFKRVLSLLPGLLARLGIPEDHLYGYAMSFGPPAVTYQRTVEREPADVQVVRW